MNLVELKKGEGMYVGADGIHAWLLGGTPAAPSLALPPLTLFPDIVELMAASDNVPSTSGSRPKKTRHPSSPRRSTLTLGHQLDPSPLTAVL